MRSGIKPITVFAGSVGVGSLSAIGLHVAGLVLEKPELREAGNWVFLGTAVLAFLPLVIVGIMKVLEKQGSSGSGSRGG
jgi:hypothetical protein